MVRGCSRRAIRLARWPYEEAFESLVTETLGGMRVHEQGTLAYVVHRVGETPTTRCEQHVARELDALVPTGLKGKAPRPYALRNAWNATRSPGRSWSRFRQPQSSTQ